MGWGFSWWGFGEYMRRLCHGLIITGSTACKKRWAPIKASETQKLQRLADNLIDEEADANNKVKQSRPDLPKEALRILVRCRIKYKTWSQVS
jgi:hypothetical protein